MKNPKKIITVLIILLILSLGYIIYLKTTEKIQKKYTEILNTGIQIGYEKAVVQIIQETSECNPVPVTYGNTTIKIIKTDCLS